MRKNGVLARNALKLLGMDKGFAKLAKAQDEQDSHTNLQVDHDRCPLVEAAMLNAELKKAEGLSEWVRRRVIL